MRYLRYLRYYAILNICDTFMTLVLFILRRIIRPEQNMSTVKCLNFNPACFIKLTDEFYQTFVL